MSTKKHSVDCRCNGCKEYNRLSGVTYEIAGKMIEAQRLGRKKEVENLSYQLTTANNEARKLAAKLQR